jgi:hypothetical protein
MTRLESALQEAKKTMDKTGRSYVLVYMSTHSEVEHSKVGLIYGGNTMEAKGLAQTADQIMSDIINYDNIDKDGFYDKEE